MKQKKDKIHVEGKSKKVSCHRAKKVSERFAVKHFFSRQRWCCIISKKVLQNIPQSSSTFFPHFFYKQTKFLSQP
jgi:hypothetical protein